jgi:type II secretory pathway pseudopilin PulG
MYQKLSKKKSNKKSFLLLVLAAFVLPVWGGQVDENRARQVATQTLSRSSAGNQLRAQSVKTVQLLYKSSSNGENTNASMRSAQAKADESVYFYVFGGENNEGFVIVAGDDRVMPVLGYSDTNGFSANNMPPNLKWWLGEYAKQIQFAIDNNIEPTQETQQQWEQYFGNNNNGEEE